MPGVPVTLCWGKWEGWFCLLTLCTKVSQPDSVFFLTCEQSWGLGQPSTACWCHGSSYITTAVHLFYSHIVYNVYSTVCVY